MNLEATVKSEIIKLFTLHYEKDKGKYKIVMRTPNDPDIDQVVDNIKTIYARYHLGQEE